MTMTMTHLRKRGTRYCNREAKRYPEEFKMQVAEDRDIYLANGTLYVPEKTSWDYIKNAKCESAKYRGDTGQNIGALENEHPNQLKDVIPKIYTKINLDHYDLAYLNNLFSSIRFGLEHRGKDIFSRIYEYFLGKFTEAEGKKQKAKRVVNFTPQGASQNLLLRLLM